MNYRRLRALLWSFAVLCSAVPTHAQGTSAAANSSSPARAVREDYVIQPLDMLRLQVFQEDDLLREVRVTQGGTVSLPLVGTVSVRNLSVKEAQERIRELYDRDYIVNPQVNLSVLEYAERTVNVLGSVNSPGAVLFPQEEGLTLLDVIARAGGFNRFADRRKIKLSRTDNDGRTETYIIDADDLMKSGTNDSWPLQRDDVIFVPERIF